MLQSIFINLFGTEYIGRFMYLNFLDIVKYESEMIERNFNQYLMR